VVVGRIEPFNKPWLSVIHLLVLKRKCKKEILFIERLVWREAPAIS
jgi:hypothetical protein